MRRRNEFMETVPKERSKGRLANSRMAEKIWRHGINLYGTSGHQFGNGLLGSNLGRRSSN